MSANKFNTVDFSKVDPNPIAQKITSILCEKSQNNTPLFYQVLVTYYLGKMASMMNCKIDTKNRGKIPTNIFAINLAPSGFGKNFAVNLLEDQLLEGFRQEYVERTFPLQAEVNVAKIANNRAAKENTDPDDELERAMKDFNSLGSLVFSFSEATVPAIKQLRHKFLMAKAGALNLEIDEIGSNLTSSLEPLAAYLEMYDVGKIKDKLTKNTGENKRLEQLTGSSPANLLMFGTPSKVYNASKTEQEFMSLLDTGYARRCFFGFALSANKSSGLTAEELYDRLMTSSSDTDLDYYTSYFTQLADPINFDKTLKLSKQNTILWLEYQLWCEQRAHALSENQELRKAELSHRYFKALKLAGIYAFIDGDSEVQESHLMSAFKLAEESGESFDLMLNRDKHYMKIARYLASVNTEVTAIDLAEDLPCFSGTVREKADLMIQAITWGYKNNVIIKRIYENGIEFFKGESLKETDLNKTLISYSTDLAHNYVSEEVPFDKLHQLTQTKGYHWCSHHFKGQHRTEENAIKGFNLVVLDVDGTTSLSTAKLLLQDYRTLFYTTKRHGVDNQDRFRIVIPTNYELNMDSQEYKEFMFNLVDWLPFKVDDATFQRSRKWLSHDGQYEYNEGMLLDVLPFIPKTKKNEEREKQAMDQKELTNLERWFVNNIGLGNRSNQIIKYALMLVDSGKGWDEVRQAVYSLNSKIADKLPEHELDSTIMVTVGKALAKQAS